MPAVTSELPPATSTTHTAFAARTAPYDEPVARRLHGDPTSSGVASWLPALPSIAPIVLSTLLPAKNVTRQPTGDSIGIDDSAFPTFRPPSIESLVASSAEDLSNFRDVSSSFDIFDEDDDLFGSPLAFDASEHGLWNGRFVPPPPRPPFFVDEPVLSDGLTTCDLCSWAMPTKSTFIFEGTIEKASELGWPLTLIIVSILSALLGAIIMITVVRCRRKKASNNRNETHVQWWSRNKRPNSSTNNNHLRRSNIYTAHPADSIRGLQQPSLSAASSLTTMTAMGGATAPQLNTATTPTSAQQPQQPQYYLPYHQHSLPPHPSNAGHYHHVHESAYEHEYHQPQELQRQLQHQRQNSSSISSAASTPTLSVAAKTLKPIAMQLQHQPLQHQHPHVGDDRQQLRDAEASGCHWPNATIVVAS